MDVIMVCCGIIDTVVWCVVIFLLLKATRQNRKCNTLLVQKNKQIMYKDSMGS